MWRILFTAFAFSCICCTPVAAQTEEQTAAFILHGIESGKAVMSICGQLHQPEVLSSSPAKYRWECKRKDGSTAETVFLMIRKIANCKYEVLEGTEGQKVVPEHDVVTIDFNNFQKLLPINPKYLEDHFFLAGRGFCVRGVHQKANCNDDKFLSVHTGSCCSFGDGTTPYLRREAAINHLFKTYCGRGAF